MPGGGGCQWAGCPIISNSLPALFMPTPKLNDLVAG